MARARFEQLLATGQFDAVLFDLDGVITATARVHAAAWKELFDSYLHQVADRTGEPFREFEVASDYRLYVDGKPRYEGVRSFLESRDIDLPYGDPEDPPGRETVCGLGNRKNILFNEHIQSEGPEVFETTVELIRELKARDIKVAVVSSSKNTQTVLRAAQLTDLFDASFDGNDAAELELIGKPTPDTYLAAASRLGVPAERAVVVEDAISGVQAGRSGGFGLVIGVDRTGDAAALAENGADVVVADMGELLQQEG
jgi:alpha,alpha-trehalase